MKKYITYLLKREEETKDRFGGDINWSRLNDTTISVSCFGYNHQDLMDTEAELLKLGCKYDFKTKTLRDFDSICGRTFQVFNTEKAV